MLAACPERELVDSLTDEGIRLVLKLAAETCDNVNDVEQERDEAAICAAELLSLLDPVAGVFDALPSPEGGSW
jgi:hypothetical protein